MVQQQALYLFDTKCSVEESQAVLRFNQFL